MQHAGLLRTGATVFGTCSCSNTIAGSTRILSQIQSIRYPYQRNVRLRAAPVSAVVASQAHAAETLANVPVNVILELAELDSKTAGAISGVLKPALTVASVLMIVRIVMSWYPEIDGKNLPWSIAYTPTGTLRTLLSIIRMVASIQCVDKYHVHRAASRHTPLFDNAVARAAFAVLCSRCPSYQCVHSSPDECTSVHGQS